MPSADFLSDFPERFDTPLPAFTADGGLPPGDFLPSRLEFEKRFVETANRERRSAIYEGWSRHRSALLLAGGTPASRQLLNGSYTTDKETPGDIDLAVEVPMSNREELAGLTLDHPIVKLLQGPLTKPEYDCDAYPIFVLPSTDPNYSRVTVRAIQYWTKWFGRGRNKKTKGRVWAETGGLQ